MRVMGKGCNSVCNFMNQLQCVKFIFFGDATPTKKFNSKDGIL